MDQTLPSEAKAFIKEPAASQSIHHTHSNRATHTQSAASTHTDQSLSDAGSRQDTHAALVHTVRRHRLTEEQAQEISSLFAILKDPTRLQVLYTLLYAPQQELCVSDIAHGLERDDTTISHQLRLLRAQRVVAMRKEGRTAYYRLIDDHIKILLELAHFHTSEEA